MRREDKVWVPGADDVLRPGDTVLLIGRQGEHKVLQKLLVGR